MPDQPGTQGEATKQSGETRCPGCGYFILEKLFGRGELGIKLVCKRCRKRLLVTFSAESVTVGQI